MKENKMGVMPMTKLIITMSLPMMLSMLVQALYNIVDSIWVAQIHPDALTAVSLAFPVQNLMIAFGSGLGVGMNALISRALGAKQKDRANSVAMHGLVLAMFTAVLFTLFGIFGTRWFFSTQIAEGTATYDYGVDYLSICAIVSVGLMGQITCERLMQSTGKTTLSMASQLTGALINMILDPLIILGIGPFPRLETKGAAIATVVGQCSAFMLGIILNKTKNKELSITFKGFKFSWKTVKDIYAIGIPSILMIAIGSVMTYLFNQILLTFTEMAVTVFGIYFKLQGFFFMPVFGLNNGVVPIIAYNYGAKKKERMLSGVKISLIFAVSLMAVGTLIIWLIPDKLLLLFKATEDMLTIGVPALRIISSSFVLAAVGMALSSIFQALGRSYYSMIVSFARQLVVLIPAAWALGKCFGLSAVWFSFPISEAVSMLVSIIFFVRVKQKIIEKI